MYRWFFLNIHIFAFSFSFFYQFKQANYYIFIVFCCKNFIANKPCQNPKKIKRVLLKFVLYLFLFSNKSYEWLPGIWFISTLQNSRYTAQLIMTIFVFLFFSFWIEQIVMFLISVIIALIYGLINTESSAKWASVRCIDPNIQEMMILIDAT